MTGTFISFEGPDGGGKTTQITLLASWLRAQGRTVISVREPGGTPIGDQIRGVLHALDNKNMDYRAEFLLYAASRAQLVHEVFDRELALGHVLLADRYIDSTFAYQGYGRQLDLDTLRRITDFATGGLTPALTIYLDIDPAEGIARRLSALNPGSTPDDFNRMDSQELAFYERVRAGYEQLIAAEPARWVRIAAGQPIDVVQAAIRTAVRERLGVG